MCLHCLRLCRYQYSHPSLSTYNIFAFLLIGGSNLDFSGTKKFVGLQSEGPGFDSLLSIYVLNVGLFEELNYSSILQQM